MSKSKSHLADSHTTQCPDVDAESRQIEGLDFGILSRGIPISTPFKKALETKGSLNALFPHEQAVIS